MAGERIGPEQVGLLTRIMRSWFGDEGDAVAEQAAAESPEFNARMRREGFILPVDMVRELAGDPGPNDVGGPSGDALEAVTKFATKADRIEALNKLNLEGRADDVQRAVFEWLKKRYPRVMAHNNRVGVAPLERGPQGNVYGVNSPRTGIDDVLGNKGVSSITIDPSVRRDDFAETLGHELTHTAQRLGNRRGFNKAAVPHTDPTYKVNNYERSARKTGSRIKAEYQRTRERRANRTEDRIPADWDERVAEAQRQLGDRDPATLDALREQLFSFPKQDSQTALTESTMDYVRRMLRGE